MTKDWPSWLTKSTLTPCLMYSIRVRSPWRAKSKSLVANSASSCSLFSSVMQVSLSCQLRIYGHWSLEYIIRDLTARTYHKSSDVNGRKDQLAHPDKRVPTHHGPGHIELTKRQRRQREKEDYVSPCRKPREDISQV